MMRLLVTRPMPDAVRQAERLKALGHEVFPAPMLEVQFLDTALPSLTVMQALIATSRNALRALEAGRKLADAHKLPLFAVGKATAELARDLGFREVYQGPGRAEALPLLIGSHCATGDGALLHLAGERLGYDVKGALEKQGFAVTRCVLYATRAADSLGDAHDALASGALDGVILMSPATAQSYVTLVGAHGLEQAAAKLTHFCLSQNVADALAVLDGARMLIAKSPSEDDLFALLG
jgi:uroporphyrinogen-III synthase